MTIATVIHTYDPTTERHARCMPTHPADTLYHKPDGYIKVKDYLALGLELNRDIVVFTNDDVAFPPTSFDRIMSHARKWDYGCSRRPRIPTHIGREIFWFKSDWLREHFTEVPECFWGVQKPDLILARWMRRLRGIDTTMENLYEDFWPVELCAGIVTHEDHPSHWTAPEIQNCQQTKDNERIWREMGPIKER